MAETPKWPVYQVGPKDSIFAIGVISVNYARLDFPVHAMFATILGLSQSRAARIMFKMNAETRCALMLECLTELNWPENVRELAKRFVQGYKICHENRNKLMHSALFVGSEVQTMLYKTERDGSARFITPTIQELRQIADDIMLYFDFGLHLANMINLNLLGNPSKEGDFAHETWPHKPALPNHMEYTSDPNPNKAQQPRKASRSSNPDRL